MSSPHATLTVVAVPTRHLPVRGLFLLTAAGHVLPGVIFNDPAAAELVAQRMNALDLGAEQLAALARDPQAVRELVVSLAAQTQTHWLTADVQRLLEQLRSIGWNQAKLARKLDIDPNTVSRWITGRTPVPRFALEYLEALCAVRQLVNRLEL